MEERTGLGGVDVDGERDRARRCPACGRRPLQSRGPPARAAGGDALLPRRADAGGDREPARGIPADGGTADRAGQGQGTGPHRGGRAAGHARQPARRRGARARTAVRPHRSSRRGARHRCRCTRTPCRIRKRRAGRGRPADASAVAERRHGLHLGPGDRSRWRPHSHPGWRVAGPWFSSTALCRPRPTRPEPSSSSAAARMCCGPTTIRLPAPLYADPSTVASMRSDSVISRTLEAGRRADVDAVRRRCGLDRRRHCSKAASSTPGCSTNSCRSVRSARSAVGSSTPTARRSTPNCSSVRFRFRSKTSEACQKTILISSGAAKHHATLGALRGKLARLLVCDIDCARWLLAQ